MALDLVMEHISPPARFGLGIALALVLAVLLCLSACGGSSPVPPAEAQTTSDTVTWTNPTARTDGTALTNLASIRIQWGPRGGPYSAGQQIVAAPATTATIPRANTPGTVCYVLTAVDANGITSVPTGEACRTIVAPPNPPTNVTVS